MLFRDEMEITKFTLHCWKMVIKFFLKIKNIIIGNWRNLIGFQSDETKRRRQICKSCDKNVKFMNTRVCSLCGCVIKAKTTVENEKCYLNKW